ncbi:hypothetical protein JW935_11545 [candidate division KSB1 bacterium]|nr:hypothetical protein [candidate division KSB1 bacterium]
MEVKAKRGLAKVLSDIFTNQQVFLRELLRLYAYEIEKKNQLENFKIK